MRMDSIRTPSFIEDNTKLGRQIQLGIGDIHVSGEAFFETNHPGIFVDKDGHMYSRDNDGNYTRID